MGCYKGYGRSALKAFSLFCRLYQLDQRAYFVLGGSIKTAIPLGLGESLSEIDLNGKVRLPAGQDTRAGEITTLCLTVGKGNLPSQSGTPGL
jgi:hypothetical protein